MDLNISSLSEKNRTNSKSSSIPYFHLPKPDFKKFTERLTLKLEEKSNHSKVLSNGTVGNQTKHNTSVINKITLLEPLTLSVENEHFNKWMQRNLEKCSSNISKLSGQSHKDPKENFKHKLVKEIHEKKEKQFNTYLEFQKMDNEENILDEVSSNDLELETEGAELSEPNIILPYKESGNSNDSIHLNSTNISCESECSFASNPNSSLCDLSLPSCITPNLKFSDSAKTSLNNNYAMEHCEPESLERNIYENYTSNFINEPFEQSNHNSKKREELCNLDISSKENTEKQTCISSKLNSSNVDSSFSLIEPGNVHACEDSEDKDEYIFASLPSYQLPLNNMPDNVEIEKDLNESESYQNAYNEIFSSQVSSDCDSVVDICSGRFTEENTFDVWSPSKSDRLSFSGTDSFNQTSINWQHKQKKRILETGSESSDEEDKTSQRNYKQKCLVKTKHRKIKKNARIVYSDSDTEGEISLGQSSFDEKAKQSEKDVRSDGIDEKNNDVLKINEDMDKITKGYFDEEAELSGEDVTSDENEDSENNENVLEFDENPISNELVRHQIAPFHMKQMHDEDDAIIKRVKNTFLDDGELYSEDTRIRRYAWANEGIDKVENYSSDTDNEIAEEVTLIQDKHKWLQEKNDLEQVQEYPEIDSSKKFNLRMNIIDKGTTVCGGVENDMCMQKTYKKMHGSFL